MKIRMSDRAHDRVKLYAGFIMIAEAMSVEGRGRLFMAILQDANGMEPDASDMEADEYIAFLAYKAQQVEMEAGA